jgi:hypothetical protein
MHVIPLHSNYFNCDVSFSITFKNLAQTSFGRHVCAPIITINLMVRNLWHIRYINERETQVTLEQLVVVGMNDLRPVNIKI